MSESNFSGDGYDDVDKFLEKQEKRYRQLFNIAYADACSYAQALATFRHIRHDLRAYRTTDEVKELERWFNAQLDADGCQRTDG